jgi:hypothetical protein
VEQGSQDGRVVALLSRKSDGQGPVKLKAAPSIDPDIEARLKRGQARLRELAPGRNECWEFFRNNTYVIKTKENQLVITATGVSAAGGDPPHRVRTRRPVLMPFVRQEVSFVTQRVPGYDVTPTNTDPDTVQAAKASEKIALYGYEKWRLKHAAEKIVTSAIVGDEAFAWPYWDENYGAVIGEDAEGPIRQGEICVRTYTSNQVGWEPGVRFEDSRWWFIQQARPVDEILDTPGCLVSELNPDATDKTVIGTGLPTSNTKLALEITYLERPSEKHRNGRRVVTANGKRIMPVENYPLSDAKGNVVNEPPLLNLSVIVDPDSDHDHGLVKFVLDCIRTYQEATNKQLQYSKHMLPQMIVPPGTQVPFDDTPMAVFEHPRPNDIKFREPPQTPRDLTEIADRALADVARAFSQNEIPAQVDAARAIQALIDRDQNARAAFVANFADFQARLMHRCLNLVCQYYTVPQLITVTGDFGTEVIPGFKGAQLMNQTQVRVLPGSLESKSREQVQQFVGFLAQLQWIGPEDGIAAIQDGTTDGIGADFDYDRARAYEIISKIKQGPEALFNMPDEVVMQDVPVTGPDGLPAVDPMSGQPMMTQQAQTVPGWMPRDVDNIAIHKAIFARWMKSAEWPMIDVGMRTAATQYVKFLNDAEQQRAQKNAMMQSAQAEGFGAANAAQPQVKPMPSLPNPTPADNPAGAQ